MMLLIITGVMFVWVYAYSFCLNCFDILLSLPNKDLLFLLCFLLLLLYFTIETKQEIIKIFQSLFHGTRNNSLFPRQAARRLNNCEGICTK